MAGLFVSFEGPEGAGKSTQIARLADRLGSSGYSVRRLREPGGTPLGDRLRALLLEQGDWTVAERSEALLYAAARAQLVTQVLRPALDSGMVVLSDRYADSTLAYQGYGRGIPLEELRAVLRFAIDDLWPQLTFLLDLPVEIGLARKAAQGTDDGEWNRFEAEAIAFHERVRAGYRALAAAHPSRWRLLDATQDVDALGEQIWRAVSACLPQRTP